MLLLASMAAADSGSSPTMFLSSSYVSFVNGFDDTIDATITNNDAQSHTFDISVFPASIDKVFATTSLNHVTLAPQESTLVKVTLSSLFEAEFTPRQFTVTAAATDSPGLIVSKDVVVNLVRKSPVFVLSLVTDKVSYSPGETVNVSSVVANQGGDTTDEFTMQAVLSVGGDVLKRFQTDISFLSQKSRNTFSNLYTLDQFSKPGDYSAQLILKDSSGQTLSIKSVNFKVLEVSKASQQETNSAGVLDMTTTITAKNEGNTPSDLQVVAEIPTVARDIFSSDVATAGMTDQASGTKVTWTFSQVAPGQTVQVVYKLEVWKIWVTILLILVVVYFAFRFVFTVKIVKRSRFLGPLTKDSEVPVSIEIVNRSVHEVKDLYVKDFIPPIAKVVPKFETVKPTIREVVGGTEVIWKFDSLRAGEERIMSYRIKPKMDVIGTLKLNPASLSYSTKRRQKRSAASGIVVVREN